MAANTTIDDSDDGIDAAAAALGLTIAPEWKPNVRMFVEVARGMAKLVEATHAASTTEAAPTFTPRDYSQRDVKSLPSK
jgi:hypothetical protein